MRYSDDFIIVIPDADGLDVKEQLKEIIGFISEVPRLTLEPKKTQCYRYHEGMIEDMGEELQVKVKSKNPEITFLGFTFNGSNLRVKDGTQSRFCHRVNRSAKAIGRNNGFTPDGKRISKRKYYDRYSVDGAKKGNGNYMTYIIQAGQVFDSEESVQALIRITRQC